MANKIVDIIRANDINYLRLESITSTGTQYIDTGIKAPSKCRIDAQFKLDDIGSNYGSALYGYMNSLEDGDALGVTYHLKTITPTTQGEYELWSYYGDKEYTNNTVPEAITDNRAVLLFWLGDRQRFVLNTTDTKITQYENDEGGGGALYYTQGHHFADISYKKYPQYPWHFYDVSDFTTAGNIYIFAFNQNGSPYTYYSGGEVSCYGFDMYDNDLNPLIKLVPVERQSDGVIGMLDTLTGTFLTNQGTDDFIKGEYIYVAEINEGHYQFTGINAYEELEYIHFPDYTGTAPMELADLPGQPFVDIDYHPDWSISVEAKYKISQDVRSSSKLNGQTIFHTCDAGWTGEGFGFYSYQGTGGTWYVDFRNDEKSMTGGYTPWSEAPDGGPMVVQINRWDGTTPTSTCTHCVHKNDDTTAYGVFTKTVNNEKWHARRSIRIGEALLETATSTTTSNFYKLWGSEIYYLKFFKIIDEVDTLDAWLVPVRRLYDGVCGFYDKVRNRFFGPGWDEWYTKDTGITFEHRPLESGPSLGTYITGPVTFNDASYLEFKSTSTGYFELPYKVNNKTKIECDISFTSAGLSVESNPIFLGYTNFNFLESPKDVFGVSIYEGDLISFHGSRFVDAGEGSASIIFPQADKIYKVCKDMNKLYVDGVLKVTNTEETFEAENNLIMGKALSINTNGIKYYRIRIYDDNVLLYDLIPVCMNDVVCGFVDTINKTFYKYTGGDDTMFTGIPKKITRITDKETNKYITFNGSSNDSTPLMSAHPSMSESTPAEDSIDYREEP